MNTKASRGVVWLCVMALATAAAASTSTTPVESDERLFLSESHVAMEKMMQEMHVQLANDVDADFAAMMIPHHQGAIDMAILELRYGHNEQLRRIAQEIIVDQQQEITAMRLALGQPLPPSSPAQTEGDTAHSSPVQNAVSLPNHQSIEIP